MFVVFVDFRDSFTKFKSVPTIAASDDASSGLESLISPSEAETEATELEVSLTVNTEDDETEFFSCQDLCGK